MGYGCEESREETERVVDLHKFRFDFGQYVDYHLSLYSSKHSYKHTGKTNGRHFFLECFHKGKDVIR